MKICTKCGKENADDSAFCNSCGASLNDTPEDSKMETPEAVTTDGEATAGSAKSKKAGIIVVAVTVVVLIAAFLVFKALGSGSSASSDEMALFHNGLLAVQIGKKWGYIDQKGSYAINPQFDVAGVFADNGLALVGNESSSSYEYKFGYIDKKGTYVINPQFDIADDFSDNGLALVYSSNKWGYIDKKGSYVINPQFDDAANFVNGLAAVCINDDWGYIDKNGSYVINPQFDEAGSFTTNDLALVSNGSNYGYINKKGSYVINPQFDFAFDFSSCGLAGVRQGTKYGYIDKSGNFVVERTDDAVSEFFDDGYAVVFIGSSLGIIDSKGGYVANPQFEMIGFDYSSSDNSYWDIYRYVEWEDYLEFCVEDMFVPGLSAMLSSANAMAKLSNTAVAVALTQAAYYGANASDIPALLVIDSSSMETNIGGYSVDFIDYLGKNYNGISYTSINSLSFAVEYSLWSENSISPEYLHQLTVSEQEELARKGIIIGCYPLLSDY